MEKLGLDYIRRMNPTISAVVAVAAAINQLIDEVDDIKKQLEMLRANSLTFTPRKD